VTSLTTCLTGLDKTASKYPLLRAVCSFLFWPYVIAMPVRLAVIAGNYSRTFVMMAAIRYLETPAHERNTNYAYGLVAATALTYYGTAVGPPLNLDQLTFRCRSLCSATSSIASKS
jgi:hypothetical protein